MPDDESRIEQLKKSLYSRAAPDVRTRRKLRFAEKEPEIKTGWDRPAEASEEVVLNKTYEDHSMSFFTKLLIGSFVFCVIAVGVGAYLFFNGANLISANNIDINISGPVSIPGGEPVSFDITVANKNNVDLQLVDMSVDFPAGATDPKDSSRELKTYRELIGDISAGRNAHKTVSAIIFGEENLQKQIAVTLTYSVKGSSAVFTKTKSYDVLINSSPINVSVNSFKELTSGQEFDTKVSITSNSKEILKNVILKAQYPFGYAFLSSDVKVLPGNTTWKIGDIAPGTTRNITIHGKLQGEDNEERVFRFSVGAQSTSDSQTIGTEYMSVQNSITLEKPFISLAVEVNGESGMTPAVGSFNQPSRVQIRWFNNLPTSVNNLEITAHLAGNAYDVSSVRPDLGIFRSSSNDIVWNQRSNSELASVGPGDSGTVSFAIVPKNRSTSGSALINPTVTITTSVSGVRSQESNVSGELAGTVSRDIKVPSSIQLTGRVLRNAGPFSNTGPIPPKVDRVTTYTVLWTVDNTSSSVSDGVVVAKLPPYIKWTGQTSPSGANINFDQTTGEVTWYVGSIGTYTVGSDSRKEAAFQISIEPGANQAESSPTLINQTTFTARDDFTGVSLESVQDYLTTRFSTDPTYKDGDERVVR